MTKRPGCGCGALAAPPHRPRHRGGGGRWRGGYMPYAYQPYVPVPTCPPGTMPVVVDGVVVDCRAVVVERSCPPGTFRTERTMRRPDGTLRRVARCERPGLGALGVGEQIATLVWPGGSYELTTNDVLWMARMAWCEGGTKPGASLWTLTQRFVAAGAPTTLAEHAQRFSQCLSPRWRAGGDLCLAHPATCTPAQQARRAQMATASWDDMPQGIRDVVQKWALAQLANPAPRAVNWGGGDQAWLARYLSSHPGSRLVTSACLTTGVCNHYFAEGAARAWSANHVTMRVGDRVAGAPSSGWFWGGLAALAAAGAGALALRGRR